MSMQHLWEGFGNGTPQVVSKYQSRYLVRMPENTDQKNSESDTFHAVHIYDFQ